MNCVNALQIIDLETLQINLEGKFTCQFGMTQILLKVTFRANVIFAFVPMC